MRRQDRVTKVTHNPGQEMFAPIEKVKGLQVVQWHDPTFSRNLAWSANNHFYVFSNSF